MTEVLVTDGRSRASLAVVRSLGEKNINITSGESFRYCSSFYSKYTKKRILYPNPDLDIDPFKDFLLEYVSKKDVEMIIPIRDSTTLTLARYRRDFEKHTLIPTPDYDKFIIGRDKSKTMELAEKLEIPHPKTFYEADISLSEIGKELGFPLLLKPVESSGSRGIRVVKDASDLDSAYKSVCAEYGPPLVQEFIPLESAIGVSMLYNKGERIAFFTHKRLREYPISGGPSTLRESIRHPEAEGYATRILDKLKWHGVAMVEFRVDGRDHKPKLMEINPRFWGSLPLAVASGVDFPYLLYKIMKGGHVEPIKDYKHHVKCRWFLLGDLLWFLGAPLKQRFTSGYFNFFNSGYDVLSWKDPFPAAGAIADGLISLTRRSRRRHAFKRGW